MNIYHILSSKLHNPHYLSRYIKFIKQCSVITFKERCDKHHICPKAADLFPEYADLTTHTWNLIYLPRRYHIVAHILLSKAFGGSQIFALTRICKGNPKYRKSRFGAAQKDLLFAKNIKTGEKIVVNRDEFLDNDDLVGVTKGIPNVHAMNTCPAIDKYGNRLGKVSTSDPRWETGEIMHTRKGVKSNMAAARDTVTGKKIGMVMLDDPRWSTGEIISTQKGAIFTDSHRNNIKKSHICRKGEYNTFYGKTHRKESIEKMLESRDYASISGSNNKNSRRVRVNGTEYGTVGEAGSSTGLGDTALREYLKGRRSLDARIWEAVYLT